MTTPADLAAQLHSLADQVAALKATPDPGPTPDPTPGPAPGPGKPPAAPTGLKVTTLADKSLELTWDVADNVDVWDVLDVLNVAEPLKETVTSPRSIRSEYKAGSASRRYAVVARNAAGLSPQSNLVDVPAGVGPTPAPGPAPTPTPTPQPGSGIDLSRWKLTLPIAKDGKVVEIKPPALASYRDKFWTPVDGGYRCRTWHGGLTTSGSPNPRTELRELNADGSLAKWSIAAGDTTCEVVGQVNRLTKIRPHVVLLQIHGSDDDVTVFRLEGTKLWITDGDDTHAHLVTDAFPLGQRYTLKMRAAGGLVRYWYNGAPVGFELRSADSAAYWKAGLYLQSNPNTAPGESTDEYAELVLHSVSVTRS